MEEPMDIDNDFDNKENTFHHSNVLPQTPCTEKGYEELDVSELNMKLRYSITPASSPMSRSYNVNSIENKIEKDNLPSESSNMSRSLNSTVTLNDTFKSSKTLPLQTLSIEPDCNNSVSILQPLESKNSADNMQDYESLSLPSTSSSLAHTPDATTPTKDNRKEDGSPIMRGLKSVLSMFRPSQSPIIPSEEKLIEPTTETESQNLVASTPISSQKHKDRKSPHKESITFTDDLEKELQWKDETTVIFSNERIPIQKLFPQEIMAIKNRNTENLDDTVEYMDVSYNNSAIADKTMTKNQSQQPNKTEITFGDSDSEFVDCETTFTKDESLLLNANDNKGNDESKNLRVISPELKCLATDTDMSVVKELKQASCEGYIENEIPQIKLENIQDIVKQTSDFINEERLISDSQSNKTTIKEFNINEIKSSEEQNITEVKTAIKENEYTHNETMNLETTMTFTNNLTLSENHNSTIDILASIENITNEGEEVNVEDSKDKTENIATEFQNQVQFEKIYETQTLPIDIPLPEDNELDGNLKSNKICPGKETHSTSQISQSISYKIEINSESAADCVVEQVKVEENSVNPQCDLHKNIIDEVIAIQQIDIMALPDSDVIMDKESKIDEHQMLPITQPFHVGQFNQNDQSEVPIFVEKVSDTVTANLNNSLISKNMEHSCDETKSNKIQKKVMIPQIAKQIVDEITTIDLRDTQAMENTEQLIEEMKTMEENIQIGQHPGQSFDDRKSEEIIKDYQILENTEQLVLEMNTNEIQDINPIVQNKERSVDEIKSNEIRNGVENIEHSKLGMKTNEILENTSIVQSKEHSINEIVNDVQIVENTKQLELEIKTNEIQENTPNILSKEQPVNTTELNEKPKGGQMKQNLDQLIEEKPDEKQNDFPNDKTMEHLETQINVIEVTMDRGVNILEDEILETKEEEIILSENNSPYVSLSAVENNLDPGKEEEFNHVENPFSSKTKILVTPPSSPKIISRGNYNFDFDEIDDPFATKTKIRKSPSLNDGNQTLEYEEQALPNISSKFEVKSVPKSKERRKTQQQKRKSGTYSKVNNLSKEKSDSFENKVEVNKVKFDPFESKVEVMQAQEIVPVLLEEGDNKGDKKPDLVKETTVETLNDNDIKSAEVQVQNEMLVEEGNIDCIQNAEISSTELSIEPKSTIESVPSRNVFNIPEIEDSSFNPFASVSKMRASPVPELVLNKSNENKLPNENIVDLNSTSSSKVTDERNDTVKEINTEDEDTMEGPFLEADELSNFDKITAFNGEKVDMIRFSDVHREDIEENAEGEMFIDAEAFEFLLNQNQENMVADSGKESLFLKFDPLFAQRVSSAGLLTDLPKTQTKQSTPKKGIKTLPADATVIDLSSVAGPSNVMDMSYDMTSSNTFDDKGDDPSSNTITKPTMVVTPAVNSAVSPRNKTITPTRSNRRSFTFTSPAIAVIDRLLSMSGNNSILGQDTTVVHVNNDPHEAELALTQLRELLAEKEVNVYQLKSESNELKYRLESLESQMKRLETEGQERLQHIDSLNEKLAEKTRENKNMAVVVEEYERTIASLIAEKEQEKRRREAERTQLIRDRDEQTAHLSNMECSFNDLHSKYEKSKGIIMTYKANEDAYKKSVKEFEEKLAKMESNYELLKQHATSKLNHANQELEKINRAHEAEVLKLHAMIKRKEVEITSLEESLIRKTKANDELAAICDELINKVG